MKNKSIGQKRYLLMNGMNNNNSRKGSDIKNQNSGKQDIVMKKSSPKEEALKRAPEEVLARAIHDTLLKDKGM
jgi:hypothetical protein